MNASAIETTFIDLTNTAAQYKDEDMNKVSFSKLKNADPAFYNKLNTAIANFIRQIVDNRSNLNQLCMANIKPEEAVNAVYCMLFAHPSTLDDIIQVPASHRSKYFVVLVNCRLKDYLRKLARQHGFLRKKEENGFVYIRTVAYSLDEVVGSDESDSGSRCLDLVSSEEDFTTHLEDPYQEKLAALLKCCTTLSALEKLCLLTSDISPARLNAIRKEVGSDALVNAMIRHTVSIFHQNLFHFSPDERTKIAKKFDKAADFSHMVTLTRARARKKLFCECEKNHEASYIFKEYTR